MAQVESGPSSAPGVSAPAPAPAGSGGSSPVPVPVVPDGPVKNAVELLRQLVASLAVVLMGSLDPAERKRLPKIRQKAWRLVPQIFDLAIRKPVFAPVGEDVGALLLEYWTVSGLQVLLSQMAAARTSVEDTAKQKEAEVWKAMLVVYGVISAQAKGDPEAAQLLSEMSSAMSSGPRAQKSVKSTLSKPTPVKGKKAKEALLSVARAESGIPDPHAPPASAGGQGAPAVSPVAVSTPSVSPAVSNGGANGAGNGSAHQG